MDSDAHEPARGGSAPNEAPKAVSAGDAPTRVCQILYSGLGGLGAVAFSLLQAPRTARWAPLMAFIGIEPLREHYAQLCEKLGVPYAYFQQKQGAPWGAWRRLFSWLMRENPEVVLLHSATAIVPCFAFRLLRGRRLVAVEHTPRNAKSRQERLLALLAHALADRVVLLTPEAVSGGGKLPAILGVPKKRAVIPNGVDLRVFHPAEASRTTGAVVRLGMASRFSRLKRHDVLIDMIDHLKRLRPRTAFRLSLAGSGETFDAMRERARRRGLIDNVEFCGPLDDLRLAEWFRSLDLYLHASDSEVMSTSILQAMASGLPIIGSDIDSIHDQLAPAPCCGLLAARQDGEAFAEAALRLIDDATLRRQLAKMSRAKAESDYGSETMFEAYDALIRELGSGRASKKKKLDRY
ncbi:MAG: glycosyltransferase [Methylocystis sp.]